MDRQKIQYVVDYVADAVKQLNKYSKTFTDTNIPESIHLTREILLVILDKFEEEGFNTHGLNY